MKTVLFLTRKLQPKPGGMQTQAKALLHALAEHPDVRLQTAGYGGGLLGLPFFCVKALVLSLRIQATTVHLGDAFLSPIFFFLAVFRPALRRTVTVHGLDITWRFPGYRFLIARSLRLAHTIVAVSHYTADIVSSYGVSQDRIFVLPCTMTASPVVSSQRTKKQLLLLSRQVKRKGTCWFLSEVLPVLCARDTDIRVVIAGSGPETQRIRSCLSRSVHASCVTFEGDVTEKRKEELLLESTLLVVPNIETEGDPEGFGIVCLEAAAFGLPTVAAKLEGLEDAVTEGVTGLFFRSGSKDDAVRVILQACDMHWSVLAMHDVLRTRFHPALIASRYIHDVF